MKHTKLLVVALLVVLLASLTMVAMADNTVCTSTLSTNGLHMWVDYTVQSVADCTNEGKVQQVCAYCGAFQYKVTPALGHIWGEYEQVKQPTCVNPGVRQQHCTRVYTDVNGNTVRCPHYNTETIRYEPAATGKHTPVERAAATKPTCVLPGNKALIVCSVCGTVLSDGAAIPALGHNFDGAKWLNTYDGCKDATCKDPGVIGRMCTRDGCGYIEYQTTPKDATHNNGKNWVETIPAKEPTCTTTGCKAFYSCSVCGATKGGEVIPALGHDLNGVAWEPLNDKSIPDCIHGATIVRRCRTCKLAIEKQEVPATGVHTWSEKPILPETKNTCTSDGCTAVYQCIVCGATKGGVATKATGHKWFTVDVKSPTCTEAGYTKTECADCHATNKIVVPATGHSATWVPGPGEDARNGYVTWFLHCSICGHDIASQVVRNGETAPSGTVQTGNVATNKTTTATEKGVTAVAKTETKKTETKKTTTKTSTAKTTTSTAKKAAPKTETKAATTAAVVTAEAPAFAKLSAIKLFKEYDINGVKVTLNDNFTYTAELAEGEIVALFVDEAALAAPAEGNFLALSAEEAAEIPEGFEPTLIAVVKEASLPTAQATK